MIGDSVYHAFFVDITGPMQDLNNLLPPGSGWVLSDADGINDLGQITGTGTIGGQTHAFEMTPVGVPEPASLAVLTVCGLAVLQKRQRIR